MTLGGAEGNQMLLFENISSAFLIVDFPFFGHSGSDPGVIWNHFPICWEFWDPRDVMKRGEGGRGGRGGIKSHHRCDVQPL